jgi:hypothetical protein
MIDRLQPEAEMSMDPAFVSALVGVLGVAIGGFASFASSWLVQKAQLRDKERERQRTRREALFGSIIDEVARLYGDALTHQKDDVGALVKLYSLVAQLRLIANASVIAASERMIETIIEAYVAPNRALHELPALMQSGKIDILRDFGEACREELVRFQ